MSRYIEVDAIQKIVDLHCAKGCDGLAAACQECGADELVKEIVLKTPSIEIVRCKECKWHGMNNCPMWEGMITEDYMFCSCGERR